MGLALIGGWDGKTANPTLDLHMPLLWRLLYIHVYVWVFSLFAIISSFLPLNIWLQ
jgi:hypothetical protein